MNPLRMCCLEVGEYLMSSKTFTVRNTNSTSAWRSVYWHRGDKVQVINNENNNL